MNSATAFAPASVGNIGVGFDILGHSIEGPGDRATVRRIDAPLVRISAIRNTSVDLPFAAELNTAGASLIALREALGLSFGFEIELDKGIAFGSGMGGSAASCVAALIAANALLDSPLLPHAQHRLWRDELPRPGMRPQRDIAELAGEAVASGGLHGDNVGAMLLGGIVLATHDRLVRVPAPETWHCVVVHPQFSVETKKAREALRGAYGLSEFVAQSANLALVLSGCHNGDASLIRAGLSDVLVEPRRASLIPGFAAVKQAALDHAALGASISGAGPSVFAWFESKQLAEAAAPSMRDAFASAGIDSESFVSPVNGPAASVVA